MKNEHILSTFLMNLGTSLIGGVIAGYVLLTHPTKFTYWVVIFAGIIIILCGMGVKGK